MLAFLLGFGMGWGGSEIYFVVRQTAAPESQPPVLTPAIPALPPTPSSTPGPPPTSAARTSTATTAPPAQPIPTGGVRQPIGFAQLVDSPTGLEIMAVVTKMRGGVLVTVLAQNNSAHPVTVRSADLGPAAVAFQGVPVPTRLSRQSRRLAPGEALVYPCWVRLPEMDTGELSFTVAGVQVSGRATRG